MATIIGDDGKEYEVKPVEAVATVAAVNQLNRELPPGAAKHIEQAMVAAIKQCMADGISDPKKINARMMAARESVKKAMYSHMNDLRSQEAAAAKEK